EFVRITVAANRVWPAVELVIEQPLDGERSELRSIPSTKRNQRSAADPSDFLLRLACFPPVSFVRTLDQLRHTTRLEHRNDVAADSQIREAVVGGDQHHWHRLDVVDAITDAVLDDADV